MKKFWALVAVCCISCFTIGCGETDTEKPAPATSETTDNGDEVDDTSADDTSAADDTAADDTAEE